MTSAKIGTVNCKGPQCRIADTSLFYDSFIDVEIVPGAYEIFELRNESGDVVGAAIRLVNSEYDALSKAGQISFDFAQFGFFDQPQSAEVFDRCVDMNEYYDQLNHSSAFFLIAMEDQCTIPAFRCESGAGDVECELSDGLCVGVRVIYVNDEEDE